MSYATMTFGSLLNQMAEAGGFDPAALAADRARVMTAQINQALNRVWNYWPNFSLPHTLGTGALTLASGGQVVAANIASAEQWAFFSKDPRTAGPTEHLWELLLPGIRQGNGNVSLIGGASGQVVFGFWRVAAPVFVAADASNSAKVVPAALGPIALEWAIGRRLRYESNLPADGNAMMQGALELLETLALSTGYAEGRPLIWCVNQNGRAGA
jgi:hypothetical protein